MFVLSASEWNLRDHEVVSRQEFGDIAVLQKSSSGRSLVVLQCHHGGFMGGDGNIPVEQYYGSILVYGGLRIGAGWYCSVPVVLLQSEFGGIAMSEGRFYRQGMVVLQHHCGGFTVGVPWYCSVPGEGLQSGFGGTALSPGSFYSPSLVVLRCLWVLEICEK